MLIVTASWRADVIANLRLLISSSVTIGAAPAPPQLQILPLSMYGRPWDVLLGEVEHIHPQLGRMNDQLGLSSRS